MLKNAFLFAFALGLFFVSCAQNADNQNVKPLKQNVKMTNSNLELATFGAGCFWCVEAVFQELKGVEKVVSGFSGGKGKNPSYKEVVSGYTGHAEVAQIHFDPEIISFETLVEVFFTTHDPTTLNRQGNDVGTHYRSAIFYHSDEQKVIAERMKSEFAPTLWDDPIVTEISAFTGFYDAEEYHQNFYTNNQNYPYCQIVINPKVQKFRKKFANLLKEEVAN